MQYGETHIDEEICKDCGAPKDPAGCANCEDLRAARGCDQPAAVMHYNPGEVA